VSEVKKQAESRTWNSALSDAESQRNRRFCALGLLLVAALFCGIVMGVMSAANFAETGDPPPDSAAIQRLREQLQKRPDDGEIKEAIRREDRRLRQAYFHRVRTLAGGAFLLLAGAAAVVLCARWYASLDPVKVTPSDLAQRSDPDRWLSSRRRSLLAVAVTAGLVGIALLVMSFAGGSSFPRADPTERAIPAVSEGMGPKAAVASGEPEVPGFRENWPRFRGPTGMGLVGEGNWPQSWDGRTGVNIVWKASVPAPGNSSPVVWGNRVFLTGGNAQEREVFCFDRTSGKLLWRTPIRTGAETPQNDEREEVQVFEETGYAASTPTTDGRHVYALFATADIAAVDFDGNVVWAQNLGEPVNSYGMATSPVLYGGKLIIQFDRGTMAEDGLSALVALDASTGTELWRTPRPVPNSWSTPTVAETESGPELLTCGAPWVISYDPEFGTEHWRARVLSSDVAPSPVYAAGKAFVTNQYARVAAIRAGGSGDVTDSHVLWTAEEGTSDASSPVCDSRRFLQANSMGLVTCYRTEDGELLWEHQFDNAFWASLTLVGDLVYLPAEDGTTYIVRLSENFELIASPSLGEPILATPAFADSRIYIRGKESLYCIAKQ